MDNSIMDMEQRLLSEIDKIVWADTSDAEIVKALQGLLYQYGACQDNKTDQMFGDDDAHVDSQFRRA